MNLLTTIDWENLSPVYKTMFEQRFAEWNKQDRQSLIKDLKFLRELKKRMQENAHFGEPIGQEVLDDLDTMINDVLEALAA